MDEMTQQNSALVEENAAACRMLQEQAQSMHGRMSIFQLIDAATAPAPCSIGRGEEPPVAERPRRRWAAGRKKIAGARRRGWHAGRRCRRA